MQNLHAELCASVDGMAKPARKTDPGKASKAHPRRQAAPARPAGAKLRTGVREAARSKPRRRSAGLRRQEIVEAAVKLFSRRGFEATRAEDIAQSAKIAKGTLYLYFRSKEAIYSAAITYAVHELQALAAERIGAASTFREKLAASITVRLHFWTNHQALYRLLLTLGREARHRHQTNNLLQCGQAHLLAIFAEGVTTGELADRDYGALAWAVLDMVRGATERRMDRLHCRPVEVDAEAITAFALGSAAALAAY